MGTHASLAEAGVPHDDETYTGEVSPSPLSMDYFRGQYLKFQDAMNAGDEAYRAGAEVFAVVPDEELGALLADYEARAAWVRGIAMTLNTGAEIVNAAGGRMPALSIPGTLGAIPLLPAAVVVAVGGVGVVVGFMGGFTAGINALFTRLMARDDLSDDAKAIIRQEKEKAQAAANSLFANPLSGLAGIGKWVLIAGGLFVAWKLYKARS